MDYNLDGKLLVIQDLVDTNKQVTYELKQDNDELKKKLNRYEFE